MTHQMANQHRFFAMGILKSGNIAADRSIQVNFSLLRQLQDRQAGKGFGDGCQSKDGILVNETFLLLIAETEKQFPYRLFPIDNSDGDAAGIISVHNFFDVSLKQRTERKRKRHHFSSLKKQGRKTMLPAHKCLLISSQVADPTASF